MIKRGQDLGFAAEPGEPFGVAREKRGQHLDRDVAIQLRVACSIHLAQAAGAERRNDLVRTKTCADCTPMVSAPLAN